MEGGGKDQPCGFGESFTNSYHVAFPIWLQNSPITPMGVVAVYGGSSQEDHNVSHYEFYLCRTY